MVSFVSGMGVRVYFFLILLLYCVGVFCDAHWLEGISIEVAAGMSAWIFLVASSLFLPFIHIYLSSGEKGGLIFPSPSMPPRG